MDSNSERKSPKPHGDSSANGVLIRSLAPESPLAQILHPGDRLLAINDKPVRDEIDLLFLGADEHLEIRFARPDAKPQKASIEKNFDTPLDIEIEERPARHCRNHCLFCFIDQNPPGLRPPLYFKDEDYRLSFTHGHYISTTSLSASDLKRIAEQRLSPLYISVHATDPALRLRMLGLPPDEQNATPPPIMDTLRFLARHHIQFHTQIVLCPGWNDGAALERTLTDLQSLGHSLLSIAIVPVGLTTHREGLQPLQPMTPAQAQDLIDWAAPHQEHFLATRDERILLLSDEFYLLADAPAPNYSEDEIACQIENGVGMMADFLTDWPEAKNNLPPAIPRSARVVFLTGKLGPAVLKPLTDALRTIENLEVEVQALDNTLFGQTVTVSGLLGGADFDRALRQIPPRPDRPPLVLIPANALRPEDQRFLDDTTLDDLRKNHPHHQIKTLPPNASDILEFIIDFAEHRDGD